MFFRQRQLLPRQAVHPSKLQLSVHHPAVHLHHQAHRPHRNPVLTFFGVV